MGKKEFMSWLEKRIAEGYSESELKQQLLKNGYTEKEIDKALKYINGNKKSFGEASHKSDKRRYEIASLIVVLIVGVIIFLSLEDQKGTAPIIAQGLKEKATVLKGKGIEITIPEQALTEDTVITLLPLKIKKEERDAGVVAGFDIRTEPLAEIKKDGTVSIVPQEKVKAERTFLVYFVSYASGLGEGGKGGFDFPVPTNLGKVRSSANGKMIQGSLPILNGRFIFVYESDKIPPKEEGDQFLSQEFYERYDR